MSDWIGLPALRNLHYAPGILFCYQHNECNFVKNIKYFIMKKFLIMNEFNYNMFGIFICHSRDLKEYQLHRALKANSHIRFCNRLLTKQDIILGHGEAKKGCLNLCCNRSAHLFFLFLSTLENMISKVEIII